MESIHIQVSVDSAFQGVRSDQSDANRVRGVFTGGLALLNVLSGSRGPCRVVLRLLWKLQA